MNFLFKFVMSLVPITWMLMIYHVKQIEDFFDGWNFTIYSILFFCPILFSLIWIFCVNVYDIDELEKCDEFSLADHEFLSTYLGYFFVALSIDNIQTVSLVFSIIFIFNFVSQKQYFNPILLIFGYHFYHVKTKHGTRVFILHRGNVIKRASDFECFELRRINDNTFLAKEISNV